MGYYTNFVLTIHEGGADLNAVRESLSEITGDEYEWFRVYEDRIISTDAMKWYDHDMDCAELSERFPDVVFKLNGDGEGTGDQWDAYYKNGLCQICRSVITFPPYDPAQLLSVEEAQIHDLGRP